MATFECSVKDLMPQSKELNSTDTTTVKAENNDTTDVPVSTENHQGVNVNVKLSVYQRLYTDKNIKLAIFITLVYLVLNSEQMYTFLSNNVPFLFIEGLPGVLGKTVIGVILSFIIISFTSFFSL